MKLPSYPFELLTIVSAPFEENTYILHRPGTDQCIVVDPGLEPDRTYAALAENGWTPAAILNTHGHSDHIAGNADLKRRWPDCPIMIGELDAPKLTDPWKNLSGQFGIPITSPPADRLLRGGDVVSAAGFDLEVRDVPGHSAGHVVFLVLETTPLLVLGGDTLFAGSIGRTDFPDGDFQALARGIHAQIFKLPEDTIVLPGHGPATTVGAEIRGNPFVGMPAGYRR